MRAGPIIGGGVVMILLGLFFLFPDMNAYSYPPPSPTVTSTPSPTDTPTSTVTITLTPTLVATNTPRAISTATAAPTPAPPIVDITYVEYDPKEDELSNEYVYLKNTTGTPIDMTDWLLTDEDEHF